MTGNPDSPASDSAKRLLQVFAVLCLILMLSIIFHKGYADVSNLMLEHSGSAFWKALGQYLFRNLAA